METTFLKGVESMKLMAQAPQISPSVLGEVGCMQVGIFFFEGNVVLGVVRNQLPEILSSGGLEGVGHR